MKKLILAVLCSLPAFAFAAGGGTTYPNDPANIDLNDKTSLQNGAKIFLNSCAGCHSMQYVRYSRIAADLGLTKDQVMENLVLADQQFGDTINKSMKPEMAKKWFGVDPLDMSLVARVRGEDWVYNYLRAFYLDDSRPYGMNNTVFPDVGMPHILSDMQGYQVKSEELLAAENAIVEAKAVMGNLSTVKGCVKALGTEEGLSDACKAMGVTEQSASQMIADAEQAASEAADAQHEAEAQIAQIAADGKMFTQVSEGALSPEEYDEEIRDLVAFMAYTANPVKMKSKSMGLWAILFLVLLLIPAYFLKKEYWKDVH